MIVIIIILLSTCRSEWLKGLLPSEHISTKKASYSNSKCFPFFLLLWDSSIRLQNASKAQDYSACQAAVAAQSRSNASRMALPSHHFRENSKRGISKKIYMSRSFSLYLFLFAGRAFFFVFRYYQLVLRDGHDFDFKIKIMILKSKSWFQNPNHDLILNHLKFQWFWF